MRRLCSEGAYRICFQCKHAPLEVSANESQKVYLFKMLCFSSPGCFTTHGKKNDRELLKSWYSGTAELIEISNVTNYDDPTMKMISLSKISDRIPTI